MLVRFVLLFTLPISDPTEARYAEIARKMLASGDWITQQFDAGVPFWGKPPLSTWLSAASMGLFGVNEFGARFPSWLISLTIIGLTFDLGRRRDRLMNAALAAAILSSTALFFVSAGAVMTDEALALGTTLAMWSFWRSVAAEGETARATGFTFFVGIAVGMLAKGPVALVLVLLPVGAWTLARGRLGETWRRLPWVSGTLLAILIAVPWYVVAEQRTPGFLEYFLVGEHWYRFTEPAWKGDLYGSAHLRPLGFIWILALAGAFPWWLIATAFGGAAIARRAGRAPARDDWMIYLACWMFAPLAFFSFAHNILWTYALPGLPAFALIVANVIGPRATRWRYALAGAASLAPAAAALAVALVLPRYLPDWSHKALVDTYLRLRTGPAERLVYLSPMPRSAEFYSRGEALAIGAREDVTRRIAVPTRDFFAVREGDWPRFPVEVRTDLDVVQRFGAFLLLRKRT